LLNHSRYKINEHITEQSITHSIDTLFCSGRVQRRSEIDSTNTSYIRRQMLRQLTDPPRHVLPSNQIRQAYQIDAMK